MRMTAKRARWMENLGHWIAWHLPKWVIYYAAVRLWVYSSTGPRASESGPSITVTDALRDWEARG